MRTFADVTVRRYFRQRSGRPFASLAKTPTSALASPIVLSSIRTVTIEDYGIVFCAQMFSYTHTNVKKSKTFYFMFLSLLLWTCATAQYTWYVSDDIFSRQIGCRFTCVGNFIRVCKQSVEMANVRRIQSLPTRTCAPRGKQSDNRVTTLSSFNGHRQCSTFFTRGRSAIQTKCFFFCRSCSHARDGRTGSFALH